MPNQLNNRSIIEQSEENLCQRIQSLVESIGPQRRKIIGIAGPPASGKSTLLANLVSELQSQIGIERVIGLPMDGFHLDNVQLDLAESRHRKGAPHTFDTGGLHSLLLRLLSDETPVFAPEFDRVNDLSRNCAIKIEQCHDVVLIEGNYLLLDQPGWCELAEHFDLSISIDVPNELLQKRLVQRWLDHGLSADAALARAQSNDIPNAATVREHSTPAAIIFRPENN